MDTEKYMNYEEHNNIVDFLEKLSNQGLNFVKFLAQAEQRLRRVKVAGIIPAASINFDWEHLKNMLILDLLKKDNKNIILNFGGVKFDRSWAIRQVLKGGEKK